MYVVPHVLCTWSKGYCSKLSRGKDAHEDSLSMLKRAVWICLDIMWRLVQAIYLGGLQGIVSKPASAKEPEGASSAVEFEKHRRAEHSGTICQKMPSVSNRLGVSGNPLPGTDTVLGCVGDMITCLYRFVVLNTLLLCANAMHAVWRQWLELPWVTVPSHLHRNICAFDTIWHPFDIIASMLFLLSIRTSWIQYIYIIHIFYLFVILFSIPWTSLKQSVSTVSDGV